VQKAILFYQVRPSVRPSLIPSVWRSLVLCRNGCYRPIYRQTFWPSGRDKLLVFFPVPSPPLQNSKGHVSGGIKYTERWENPRFL